MLFLNNKDVHTVLTMADTMKALEQSYQQLVTMEAVCRPRIDIRIPTSDPQRAYQWGTMEGGSTSGYFAIRMKSDILIEQEYNGVRTEEKYCKQPGLFCGLILLFSIENGEPLAMLNDGYLQHMRVGADAGLGIKYMAREDASVVGMFGSGGMSRTYMEALIQVRSIRRLQVYSPTKANRIAFCKEIERKYGIEAVPLDHPRDVYKGADLIAGCTDSTHPVIEANLLEEGQHITNVGAPLGDDVLEKIDRFLRFGTSPAPIGVPEWYVHDEFVAYQALPDSDIWSGRQSKRWGKRAKGILNEEKTVMLEDIQRGNKPARRFKEEITYSARGNLQGAQFYVVAGKAFELAKERGLGRQLPTEWFLQDIRD